MRGLLREIATREGTTVKEIKSRIMKTIIALAKQLKARGMDWFEALRQAGKAVWNYVKTHKRVPSLAEVATVTA